MNLLAENIMLLNGGQTHDLRIAYPNHPEESYQYGLWKKHTNMDCGKKFVDWNGNYISTPELKNNLSEHFQANCVEIDWN